MHGPAATSTAEEAREAKTALLLEEVIMLREFTVRT